MLGIIRATRERIGDFILAELDLARCQTVIDFWRCRPLNLRTADPLSKKTCTNYLGEIHRFFDWLHITKDFGWRMPEDFAHLKWRVKELPTDRPSLNEMAIKTYSVEELTVLYKYAIPSERLLMVWCLNCATGQRKWAGSNGKTFCFSKSTRGRSKGSKSNPAKRIAGAVSSDQRAASWAGGFCGRKPYNSFSGGKRNLQKFLGENRRTSSVSF